ncbi:GH32 C-terminal domain-containing protein [Bacillus solitudinis]|uniref:GH32 C-terminal domain-containing protein n=1 Tax=Bacillus solitudinis TaxID=2014074 RepID=UPI000C231BAD|nr:GH32 C-terminal domain-containing protein [Bacillus solitudinis]
MSVRKSLTSKDLVAHWSFEETDGAYTYETVQKIYDSIDYVLHEARFQPNRSPKRRKGLQGTALWFDGFSTHVKRRKDAFHLPNKGMTISIWVAPYSFGGIEGEDVTALINQHNREKEQGFILGIKKHGDLTFQVGLTSGWTEIHSDVRLPRNKWTYVVATYEATCGLLEIYLNGDRVAHTNVEKDNQLVIADVDLLIGKHNHPKMIEQTFSLGMFSGLMDEVCIFQRALTAEEILYEYVSYLTPSNGEIPSIELEDINIHREDFILDEHRPQYHLTAPGHWMNEPHAPLYYKGKYHLFYQHNPQGPYWGNIHWGHWVSDDLIHWRDLPIALSPERDSVDPDGVWSGCAHYDRDGVPVLFFTAGNNNYLPNQMIGLARSTVKTDGDLDLKNWVKHPAPILFQPEGFNLDDDGFRDPFVWKEGETWYQLVGSGINGCGGTALLFESDNLINWEYRGPLYLSDYKEYPYLGRVWELPILLPLGKDRKGNEKHIFIISPVGDDADVEVFYWIGKWDRKNRRFLPEQEKPQLFDLGDFHFTGPSAMLDPKSGRIILFTIAQGERPIEYEYASGWAHNGGLPIELYLSEDGRLKFKPIDEVKELRKRKLLDLSNVTIAEANQLLKGIYGDMLEIEVVFQPYEQECYGLFIRQTADHTEETLLYYDGFTKGMFVDRTKTTLDKKEKTSGIQGGFIGLNEGEPLKLRVFVDKSMVEAYINDIKSLTTRVYPTKIDAKGISLMGSNEIIVESIKVWDQKHIFR